MGIDIFLHSALKGNVSTYHVNTDQIVAMVSDSVNPPSSVHPRSHCGSNLCGSQKSASENDAWFIAH